VLLVRNCPQLRIRTARAAPPVAAPAWRDALRRVRPPWRGRTGAGRNSKCPRTPQRLTRLHLFFAKEPEQRVLDFWGWDEQVNPVAFRRAVVVQQQRVTG